MLPSNVETLLELDLPADPIAASRSRRAVGAALTGRGLDMFAVELAVAEAVANVILHAYRDRAVSALPGRVHVAAGVGSAGACVVVADDGPGLRPRPDSPGLGLGMSLIAALCDELSIEHGRSGTRVRMQFLGRR
jgi:serine/threonine-protein kinase RsbW/stage II sporulation protein AB (anti-sigma F factor)